MRAAKAGTGYFALVFGAGFLLGAIRVPFVVPRLGERTAELLETPLMLAVIFVAARFVVSRFSLPPSLALRLGVGGVALVLLLAAELLLAVAIQQRSIRDYVASRDPVSGGVFLGALAVFAAMPAVLLRFGRESSGTRKEIP